MDGLAGNAVVVLVVVHGVGALERETGEALGGGGAERGFAVPHADLRFGTQADQLWQRQSCECAAQRLRGQGHANRKLEAGGKALRPMALGSDLLAHKPRPRLRTNRPVHQNNVRTMEMMLMSPRVASQSTAGCGSQIPRRSFRAGSRLFPGTKPTHVVSGPDKVSRLVYVCHVSRPEAKY